MNNELLKRITFNPKMAGGKPCIRGMRVRVVDVLELLAVGLTAEQIVKEELPYLELDDIKACLLYAANTVNYPVLTAA